MAIAIRAAAMLGLTIFYYVILFIISISYVANSRFEGRISMDDFDKVQWLILLVLPLLSLLLSAGTMLIVRRLRRNPDGRNSNV